MSSRNAPLGGSLRDDSKNGCVADYAYTSRIEMIILQVNSNVVYYLPQILGNSCWDVNGKRVFGSSHWKIPGTNGNSFTIYKFLEFRTSFMLKLESSLGRRDNPEMLFKSLI